MLKGNYSKRAETAEKNEKKAIEELADKLQFDDTAGIILFCSADYNLDMLASSIHSNFRCPIVACTTAGEIGSTYSTGGIVGIAFSEKVFKFHTVNINPLHQANRESIKVLTDKIQPNLAYANNFDSTKMFGFLLIDGLSIMEETITAALYSLLDGVHIIGGSAGDSLNFKETRIYDAGKFISDSAVLALIETKLPFETFKLQHFVPSDMDMVITSADSSTRTVFEINGEPAAEEYADLIGLEAKELSSQVFAMYPVMLQIGNDWYVRSIEKVNEDGSLTFFCAIDEGLPLTVAKGVGLVETLQTKVKEIQEKFTNIELTIGCDCILRRLEINEKNKADEVINALAPLNFLGFSTFGEQFNSIHVNQTLTGVVFGAEVKE